MVGLRLLLLTGVLSLPVMHPLHTTHTELQEAAGGKVTVAVRAFSDDLRTALLRRGRATDDSAMARYVRATLDLRDPRGRPVPLRLTRVEVDGAVTWMHFRAELAGGLSRASLCPTMQAELFSDQVNVVRAVYRGREQSLLFLRGDGPRTLP